MRKMRVIKGLAFAAILAISLMATSGSAAARSNKPVDPAIVVGSTGVTWEGIGFTALGVTWE